MGLNRNLGQLTEALTESSGNVLLNPNNVVGGTNVYIGQTMASNDWWRIYGNTPVLDQGEMVFELGDNAIPHASNGQRFRFFYNNTAGGAAKNPFILDYNTAIFNTDVGIGTDTPIGKLNVLGSGTTSISISNSTPGTNANPQLTQLNFLGFAQENRARIEAIDVASNTNGSQLRFYNANASNVLEERMRINSIGNVGIGNINPSSKLDIRDDTASVGTRIRVTNGSSAIFSSSGLELFSHNGSSVSIGTVLFNTNSNFNYGTISSNQTNLYGIRSGGIRVAAEVAPIIFSNGNGDSDFAIERMRIFPNGNIGINTGNNDTGSRLQVNGNTRVNGALFTNTLLGASYNQTSTSGTTSIIDTGIDNNAFGTSSMYFISFGGNPNNGGSSAYKANYVGYISVTTGFIGGSVRRLISYSQTAAFDSSGIGSLTLSVMFFNGVTESTTINEGSTNGWFIRLKINGYNPSWVGAEQYVYLTRLN
jgi:hypothetical protein